MDHEISPDQHDVDLFGNAVEPIRDRRGRPSYKKTKENQDFVSVRAAAGWTQQRIAEDMGIDAKTLRKNFSRELENGAVFIEGMALDVLMKKTREGHVPSIRLLLDRIDPRSAIGKRSGSEKTKPTPKPGKKEHLRVEAGKPSGGWAGRLPGFEKAN